nr:MAG TPA_asm: hypothetical protein [Caudoviricetes sp.]
MMTLPPGYYQLITISISELSFPINFRLHEFRQFCRISNFASANGVLSQWHC